MRTPSRLVMAASVVVTACLAIATNDIDATAAQPGPSAAPPPDVAHPRPDVARKAAKAPTKTLVFVEENHSLTEMLAGMPYLHRLATRRYAYARHYSAITSPSLPNYLAIAGGSTFGIRDDGGPFANGAKVGRALSVFDQAIARGYTAKTYAQSMPGRCSVRNSGKYAVKHNPWAYFTAGRHNCRKYDVPMGSPRRGALARDVRRGRLPNVGLAIPNLCNDAHDCPLATADHWLMGWLPSILHSPDFRSGRLAVVVTADEGNGTGRTSVLTVVLHSPGHRGRAVKTPLSHYSLSRFLSSTVNAPGLRHARHARGLGKAFKV